MHAYALSDILTRDARCLAALRQQFLALQFRIVGKQIANRRGREIHLGCHFLTEHCIMRDPERACDIKLACQDRLRKPRIKIRKADLD
jgi:hypothetical protein